MLVDIIFFNTLIDRLLMQILGDVHVRLYAGAEANRLRVKTLFHRLHKIIHSRDHTTMHQLNDSLYSLKVETCIILY